MQPGVRAGFVPETRCETFDRIKHVKTCKQSIGQTILH
jgi:hypothetical protein